jgi:hypothetical protein
VIDKAADHGVGLQARRWQRVVEDLGRSRLLHHQLAAAAGPLAADLALHEELGRNNVQPLADVLAHAHHELAALWGRAVCVLRLDSCVHARQVGRQCFALWLAAWLLVCCPPVLGGHTGLQGSQLRLQAGLISRQCLLEDRTLRGVHALGLGPKLPGLKPCQLKRDAFDLRVAPLDRLRL